MTTCIDNELNHFTSKRLLVRTLLEAFLIVTTFFLPTLLFCLKVDMRKFCRLATQTTDIIFINMHYPYMLTTLLNSRCARESRRVILCLLWMDDFEWHMYIKSSFPNSSFLLVLTHVFLYIV